MKPLPLIRRIDPDLRIGDAVQLGVDTPVMTVYDRMAGDWICCNYVKGTDMTLIAVPADALQRVERATQGKPA
ncbi:MAG TPA: hypothetical protein VNU48_00435 [Burkholderiaceae bacterium]|nr:hypothetical protein [Burkholderiaceae bacterium]